MVQAPDPPSTEARWVPYGRRADIAGHVIPRGLFYVGQYLHGAPGRTEPSLVDPELPIAPDGRPPTEEDLGPAPAYHRLTPVARGAYLHWLAGGRRTDVPAGLVLLYCFGLERRVLHDGGHDPAVRDELPAIAAEVLRLRRRYGRDAPELSDGLARLLDLLDVLRAGRHAPGPATSASIGSTVGLRVALARFAASAAPVPVEWARVWARHHPRLASPAVQAQCPDEFDRLFTLRYQDTFGPGLVPPGDMPGLWLRYRPASPELGTTLVCREDLPDVLTEPRSARALGALIDGIAGALDPYRRMVTRFPQSRGSLAATALLPADLLDADRGRFGALRVWTEARFDGRALAVVDGDEFAAFWPTASPGRMARDEAAAFIEVLALLGVGVEPDVRFGAPALGPGPVVLFRCGAPAWQRPAGTPARGETADADRPGPGFAAAAIIVRCAAALVAAGGPVVPHGGTWSRVVDTVADLAAACRTPPTQRPRLAARLSWLLVTGVDVDRLPRQVTRLTDAEREVAGSWLISVAAAVAPGFPPATVSALTRLYRILGLEHDLLFRRLHAVSVAGAPLRADGPRLAGEPQPASGARGSDRLDDPVVVQSADPRRGGFALPWSVAADAGAGARPGDDRTAGEAVRLDQAGIRRTIEESAAVGALLATIFDADDGHDAGTPPVTAVTRAEPITGLDAAHSALLRALAGRPSWTRDEFAALAGAHGVLPDGALDVLNEAAIDTAGEPVVSGGATLAVHDDVLQELLR